MSSNGKPPRELYVELEAEKRDDGKLFVKSRNLRYFSAIVDASDAGWDQALEMLREYLDANLTEHGGVVGVRLVPDIKTMFPSQPIAGVPPAHVIAQMTA